MTDEVINDELNAAFTSDTVLTDSDERLLRYLKGLTTKRQLAEPNQTTAIIRAITINAILQQRFMKSVDRRTTILTGVVIFVTALNAVAAFWPR